MMLKVAKTVAHFLFAAGDGLRPEVPAIARDTHLARNQMEIRIDYEFRTERTGAQLRSRQVEIIAFFEDVVRELIALYHSDSIRLPVPADEIGRGDLGFFAPICGVCGYEERFVVRSDHGTIALVEPLRGRTDFSSCGATAFYAPLKHLHAVGQILFLG